MSMTSSLKLCTPIPLSKTSFSTQFPQFSPKFFPKIASSSSCSTIFSFCSHSCCPFNAITTAFRHHRQNFKCRNSQVSVNSDYEEEEELLLQEIIDEVEDSELLEESDGEENLDVELLEREAKRAVKEFADDLSSRLKIG